jgi:GTP-binding protein
VWVVADASLNTLLHLRYNPLHIAGRGLHGEGSNRSGKEGADVVVRVPVGTQVFDPLTNELLFDCIADGERWQRALYQFDEPRAALPSGGEPGRRV